MAKQQPKTAEENAAQTSTSAGGSNDKTTEQTSSGDASTRTAAEAGGGVIDPGRLQPGEAVNAPVTTNPPRGVGEPPSNAIADEPAAAELQQHVQEVIDNEEAVGYRGSKVQVVPNENYTLRGVTSGKPTPETTVVTPKNA